MKINLSDITCPRCHAKNTWRNDNSSRPFCSARCKLIDLGAWASEENKIPGPENELPENDSEIDR